MDFVMANLVPVVVVAVSLLLLVMVGLVSRQVPGMRELIYRWPPLWRVVRIFVLLLIVDVLVILIYLSQSYPKTATPLLLAYVASLIGAAVGSGELIARYRDAPFSALGKRPSALYLAVNALAAGAAFLLIAEFDWKFGFKTQGASLDAVRVLVAGFGAMALFRSSLFLASIGGKDVGIGPATVLQIVLNAADAGVDRETAKNRALVVQEIMQDVDPDRAKTLLPLFCYRLLQSSLPYDDFVAMTNKIDEAFKLGPDEIPDRQNGITAHSKAYILGLLIMNYMGEDVLRAAVSTLGPEIQRGPEAWRLSEDAAEHAASDEPHRVDDEPAHAEHRV